MLYFIIGYLLQANMIDDPVEAFYEIVLQIISMLVFIGIMLVLNKTLYAFVQIATAFIFSANVLSAFVIPVMVWLTVSDGGHGAGCKCRRVRKPPAIGSRLLRRGA